MTQPMPTIARKYGVQAIAEDANGNADPTKPWVTRSFSHGG